MAWLQKTIDHDPDAPVIVPEDPKLAERAGPAMESPPSFEGPVSPVSLPGADTGLYTGARTRTGKSILIVEDEAVAANDIQEIVQNLGYTVAGIAKSAGIALEMVEKLRPDLVLMDIQLATAMDGIDATEKIHTLYDIPVIHLIGCASTLFLDPAKVTGSFGYITKPCDERELQSIIEIAFRKHAEDLQLRKACGEQELRTSEQTEELTQINRSLAESKEWYHNVFKGVSVGIYVTRPSGKILDVNPALVHLLGYPDREQLMAVSVPDLYADPGIRSLWLAQIERDGMVYDFEVQFRKHDGTIIWIRDTGKAIYDDSGRVLYYIGYIEDNSRRKRAEEALRESEEKCRQLVDRAQEGILASEQRYRAVVEDQSEFICRFLPDGTLTFVNEAYCCYFRLKREEIIGTRHSVVLPPDDLQKMKNHLAALTRENPIAWIAHRIVLPSGEVRWQRWSDRAFFNNNGDVTEYQSVGRDITVQKESEIQLEYYKENLEQQVRDRTSELSRANQSLRNEIEDRKKIQKKLLASSKDKDILLREVHHRVKNNLQLIIGLIDMTKSRAHEPIVISTLIDIMAKVQIMGLVHTRLYESKRFDKINMKRQVNDLVKMTSKFYDHDHLEITTKIDCTEIYIPVDQAIPCALALNEIISNIHKHAFKGKKTGLIEISSAVKGDIIRFVIRDNGVGLPSGFDIEMSNRLGLRLMRTLVEQQLHGRVTITGKKGTEVVIEFPINREEPNNGTSTHS